MMSLVSRQSRRDERGAQQMKIITTRGVIQLSKSETLVWEDGGPDGCDFRSGTREKAKDMAAKSGKTVEIYASKAEGGWCADQIQPE
jgi:hypothetical protein